MFAVAGYNLAETGRMIEIAKAARNDFNIVFASYGGQFEQLIEDEGFRLDKMEPRLTRERLARLRVVLSGETLNTVGYLSAEELAVRVPNEIAFFEEVNAAAALTGFSSRCILNLSTHYVTARNPSHRKSSRNS